MYFSGTIYDYDLFVLWGKIQERGLQKKLKVTTRGHPASSEHILARWGRRKTLRSEKETCPSDAVRLSTYAEDHGALPVDECVEGS